MSSLATGVVPATRGQSSSQFQIHDDGEGMQSKPPSSAQSTTVRFVPDISEALLIVVVVAEHETRDESE